MPNAAPTFFTLFRERKHETNIEKISSLSSCLTSKCISNSWDQGERRLFSALFFHLMDIPKYPSTQLSKAKSQTNQFGVEEDRYKLAKKNLQLTDIKL